MSRDIRSFFTVISKKSSADSINPITPSPSVNKKKPKKLVDSDDEDIVAGTPNKTPPTKPHKREILSSDSEDEFLKNKPKTSKIKENSVKQKPDHEGTIVLSSESENETSKNKLKTPKKTEAKRNTLNLKPANVGDVFKSVPIKQSKVEFTPKPTPEKKVEDRDRKKSKNKKKATELGIHNDTAFEQTLIELDDDDIFDNIDILEQTTVQNEENNENKPTTSQFKKDYKKSDNNKNETVSIEKKESATKSSEKKRSRSDSSSDTNTPKKKKIDHVDSGIDPDQEAHEKKRYSAMLYQKYLNRGGPKHHGMKELPKGKPDCLSNLCFLRTGVLDSLTSEEFDDLIKSHGGRVVQAVSKKVNYVVVGEDPGPSKLSKAESYNIKTMDEDELLDLILIKSGMEPKYTKKDTSFSSEDLGIEVDIKETPSGKKENPKEMKNDHTKMTQAKSEIKTEKQVKTTSEPSSSKRPEICKSTVEQNMSIKTGMTNFQNEQLKTNIDFSQLSLTEKYKPTDLKGIIGQLHEGSNMNKLKNWLQNWHKNQAPEKIKTMVKPSPWAKNDTGAYFKCALLSGPPGVGKTTTATLVAKHLGLDIVEFNASDTRSKRLLHEEVSQLLSSKTIAGFAKGQANVSRNRVLLMDEVDGMAGNEDRGGIQELIQLIKNTSIPIICMCNDRNHPKIRSLVNYCFDLRFIKSRPEQITGAMMTICFREKINITPLAMKEIVIGAGCDVRQVLNHLSMLKVSGNPVDVEEAKNAANKAKKDAVMGPWEVCRTVFTASEHKDMSVADRSRLFFYDYSIGPLFVQENYLRVTPSGDNKTAILKAALVADSISRSDIIDQKIRSNNNWALLETQAMFATVIPSYLMSGTIGQITFPGWLGKNSKKNKFSRMISELQTHMRTSTSASKMAVKLDYLVSLRDAIVRPLQKGMEGVESAVKVMKSYNLLREDFDNLLELCHWKRGQHLSATIESKVKSAFTRTYNKQVTLLPYAPTSGVTKKRAATADSDIYGNEDNEQELAESDNEEDDISKNAMIKVKKPPAKGKKTDEEAGTSKAKNSKGKEIKGKERKKGKGTKK